jgi:regulator of protease activity HflC (stomatin/prohibitin superfamily)
MKSLVVIAALLASACSMKKTGTTEVGVLVCKLGVGCDGKGVQSVVYPPGSTHFFAPFIRDFYTFDTRTQNLEMVLAKRGQGADDLQFKTTDGNDISMDVTVVWQIDPQKAPYILQNVGRSTQEVSEKLVRPMARTLVRDVLNELTSEQVYSSAERSAKADKAHTVLAESLLGYGVLVSQVILHEHRFTPEYEKVIHDRKLAEQKAEQYKSEAEAARQEALRNQEIALRKVNTDMAQADGLKKQAQFTAEAKLYEQQQDALAIIQEGTKKADAIIERNKALSGTGGRAMVKLKIAEAMQGKTIILIPTGGDSGVGVNRVDVNKLVDTILAQEANGN